MGCWVAIIVLVVLFVLGVVSYNVLKGAGGPLTAVINPPQKTLAAYCDALKTGNAQEMYDTLDSSSQKQTSVQKIQKGLSAIALLGGVKDCTYSNVQVNGTNATATITITFGSTPAQNAPAKLVLENNSWKFVDNSENLTSSLQSVSGSQLG